MIDPQKYHQAIIRLLKGIDIVSDLDGFSHFCARHQQEDGVGFSSQA